MIDQRRRRPGRPGTRPGRRSRRRSRSASARASWSGRIAPDSSSSSPVVLPTLTRERDRLVDRLAPGEPEVDDHVTDQRLGAAALSAARSARVMPASTLRSAAPVANAFMLAQHRQPLRRGLIAERIEVRATGRTRASVRRAACARCCSASRAPGTGRRCWRTHARRCRTASPRRTGSSCAPGGRRPGSPPARGC